MRQIIFAFILALIFTFSVAAQANNQLCAKQEGTDGVVAPGTPMKFVATVSGKTENLTLEYVWKVSAGTIVSGQGTCSITVDTTGLAGGTNVTAEVTVKGLPECCPNTASETRSIAPKIEGRPLDQFGKLPDDEVKARMDALFRELANDPTAQGYIINYGTDKELDARERQIQKAIAFLKYDASRVNMIRGGANQNGLGVWTKMYVIPAGAEIPQP
jgi:hypothetical protein